MKLTDFKTFYGKLGMHPDPGVLPVQQAAGLFDLVMASGSHVIEVGATTGRSTAIIATAARNIDRRVYVASVNGIHPMWFRRTILGHGLEQTVVMMQSPEPIEDASLAVLSGSVDGLDKWLEILPSKGRVVFLNNGDCALGPNLGLIRSQSSNGLEIWEKQ